MAVAVSVEVIVSLVAALPIGERVRLLRLVSNMGLDESAAYAQFPATDVEFAVGADSLTWESEGWVGDFGAKKGRSVQVEPSTLWRDSASSSRSQA